MLRFVKKKKKGSFQCLVMNLNEGTDVVKTEKVSEIRKRLGEIICIVPFTALELFG